MIKERICIRFILLKIASSFALLLYKKKKNKKTTKKYVKVLTNNTENYIYIYR